jgi:hypothetical protein
VRLAAAISLGLPARENEYVTDPGPLLSAGRLQTILRAEGYPSSMYGVGRRGQYLDQAVVIDQWSNRWVV